MNIELNVGPCIISAYLQLYRQITSKTEGKSEGKWKTGQRKMSFKSHQCWTRFSFSRFVRVFYWGPSALWPIRQMGLKEFFLATRINQLLDEHNFWVYKADYITILLHCIGRVLDENFFGRSSVLRSICVMEPKFLRGKKQI